MAASAPAAAAAFACVNASTRSKVDVSSLFAEGGFKYVYHGVYTSGPREGERCVAKIMKEDPFDANAFKLDLDIATRAQVIVDKFNKAELVSRPIYLNRPEIWMFEPESDLPDVMCFTEPLIHNYIKFNTNTGWVLHDDTDWCEVVQALSHFSYSVTSGQEVLCDLQGGNYQNGIVLSDCAISSRTCACGDTDLGPKGVAAFFVHHKCNKYCKPHWPRPKERTTELPIKIGSSMRNADGELMHASGERVPGPIIVGPPRLTAIKGAPQCTEWGSVELDRVAQCRRLQSCGNAMA
jgi:Alpha-kinase family